MVEQSAVNRLVAGSSPAWGVFTVKKVCTSNILKISNIIKLLYLKFLTTFDKKVKLEYK